MGIARREWVAVAAAAGVVLAVGCGLSLAVDESPSEDAGADGPIKPPPPNDGEAPDVLLPDGALPDGASPDGAGPDAWVDDGAVFLPSNLDATAPAYSFDGGTSLRDLVSVIVSASAGTATVTMKTGDGGTVVLPPEDVRYDAECDCAVVSVKDWAVPAGTVVNVAGDVPLVVIASGDVRIDGTVRVSNVAGATPYDGTAAVGFVGGGGGGGATPGAAGGSASGADGGGPRSPRKVLSVGGHGGASGGINAPGFTPCGHGGSGGGALQVFAKALYVGLNGRLTAVGEGSDRGCPATGGGGGGAGGTIVLEGRVADISGTVLATGGGGAGGAGLATASAPGASGAIKGGIGGDGGMGGGKGGNGGDTVPPSDGGPGVRGGGGGGAAGFVRIGGLNVKIDRTKVVPDPVLR